MNGKLAREIELKRGELAALFARHREGEGYAMPAEVLEEVNRRNDELADLMGRYEQQKSMAELDQRNQEALERLRAPERLPIGPAGSLGGVPAGHAERKSLGRLFVESAAFREYRGGRSPVAVIPDVDMKALFSTTAGWDPEDFRTRRLIAEEQEEPRVIDLYPMTTTRMSTVVYMEETSAATAATEIAEAGSYPEATFVLTEQSSEVRKIAVYVSVTDELFEDEERARDYVNNRLAFQLRQRLDSQLLNGTGSAPNLRGVLNASGIQTQAKGADPTPDAIFKAMTLVRVNGKTEASAIVMHPNDWQEIRLLRTTDGLYIWGNPSERGPERIWGLPVISTTFQPEGTAVLGDWRNFSEVSFRRGVEFSVSDAHASHFIEGKKAIRCDLRCAAIHYRGTAFCKVTGI